MNPLVVVSPAQVLNLSEPFDFNPYAHRFLAEGDSWFSLGTLNLAKSSNLLHEMSFSAWSCAVNCANSGEGLSRLVERNRDRQFTTLLASKSAWPWDGLLLSGGGNDLLFALKSRPTGEGLPNERRLLLTHPEWGDPLLGADRYISEPGWSRFAGYIRANLDDLIALRDSGPSAGRPIFMHTYAYMTPRFAPALPGTQAWIAPALHDFGIPQGDWTAVGHTLLGRLADLLLSCADDQRRYPNLHVFDTTQVPLMPASTLSTSESGDWMNETHLNWRGYEKLAQSWARGIEAVLAR